MENTKSTLNVRETCSVPFRKLLAAWLCANNFAAIPLISVNSANKIGQHCNIIMGALRPLVQLADCLMDGGRHHDISPQAANILVLYIMARSYISTNRHRAGRGVMRTVWLTKGHVIMQPVKPESPQMWIWGLKVQHSSRIRWLQAWMIKIWDRT
jgi:hypothetical protein